MNPAVSGQAVSVRVSPGFLDVDATGWGLPLVPAWSGLGDLPAGGLLDAVAGAAACAGVAGTGLSALVVGGGVLEVGLPGVPGAGRERTLPVADLNSANFGKILSAGPPRLMQFAAKLIF